ncbi:MAG: aldose 1-epimerase family protein [Clostridia bacterium]|nr:aldose 1-epimerase family protein [Clostridia bacterium]
MLYTIENERFRVTVNDFGAELNSVFDKTTETEYLWQGDPAVWSGRSPILFPIVGRLKDDLLLYKGKRCTLPKHGFGRRSEWTPAEKQDTSVTFILQDSPETLEMYPFRFLVSVTFSLRGSALLVTHEVKNTGDEDLYFSIGAHPGFRCEMGDKLRFEHPETLYTQKIDLKESLRLPDRIPVLDNADTITITPDIFNEDALILSGMRSKAITLERANGKNVHFTYGDAPFLGIWAKPGAPYVCLEPWYGVNDPANGSLSFDLKEGVNRLASGECFSFFWQAGF